MIFEVPANEPDCIAVFARHRQFCSHRTRIARKLSGSEVTYDPLHHEE